MLGVNWIPQRVSASRVAYTAAPPAAAAHHMWPAALTKALAWIKRVDCNTPPLVVGECLEMCPNLNIREPRWKTALTTIGRRLRDITLVYRCGAQLRAQAWERGIRTFDALRGRTSEFGLPPTVERILEANCPDHAAATSSRIFPPRLGPGLWRERIARTRHGLYFTIDFETIQEAPRARGPGRLWIFLITACAQHALSTRAATKTWRMRVLQSAEQRRVLQAWLAWMQVEIYSVPRHIS